MATKSDGQPAAMLDQIGVEAGQGHATSMRSGPAMTV